MSKNKSKFLEKKIFEYFYLFNKIYTESPTKITFTCMLFLKTLYLIKKYHILSRIFGAENDRTYLFDFEWRVSRDQKFIFIILKWSA